MIKREIKSSKYQSIRSGGRRNAILIVCLGLIVCSSFLKERCKQLKDGTYAVSFYGRESDNYKMIVSQGYFTKSYSTGDSVAGKIERLDECRFMLVESNQQHLDISSALLRRIDQSLGPECIEITKTKRNRMEFRTTYSGNLNVTHRTGFIKEQKK